MVRVMVRVSVIYHRDRVITGANGRCRLWSSLTNANRSMRTQIGAHLPTPSPLLSAVGPRRAPPPGLRCPPFQQLIDGHPRSDKRVSLSSTVPLALSENAFRLTCTTRCFLSLSAVHRPEASRAYPSKVNSEK